MIVEVVDRTEQLDALQPEWDEAARANTDANVFLTWEWLRTWWRHFGEGAPGAKLHVVVFRDGDGLVGAAPLFLLSQGVVLVGARVLQPISRDAGDYGGMLLVRHEDEVVAELLAHLAVLVEEGIDLVVLSRLTSDSRFLDLLRSQVGDHRGLAASEVVADDPLCPYADVTDDYDLGPRRTKARVRQRLAKLSEAHQVAFEHHTGPSLEDGLAALIDVHERRWTGHVETETGMLAHPDTRAFLLDALRAIDARGWLRLMTLRADGQAIAVRLDLEFAGRNYMLKHAIDPDFAEYGPGHLLHDEVIEDGIARGIHEFDFLRGDDQYKRRWTNRERYLVAVTISRPGVAGRIARQRVRVSRRLAAHARAGRIGRSLRARSFPGQVLLGQLGRSHGQPAVDDRFPD